MIWLNHLFLLFIAFLSFPTSVLGSHWSPTAIVFYASCLTATGIARALIWSYAVSRRLTADDLEPAAVRAESWRGWAVPAVFGIFLVLAAINANLAPLTWALLVPISIIGRRVTAKHA